MPKMKFVPLSDKFPKGRLYIKNSRHLSTTGIFCLVDYGVAVGVAVAVAVDAAGIETEPAL